MMLASHFPNAIAWGPDRITLHNDAFRPILGDKPDAQGRPFDVLWAGRPPPAQLRPLARDAAPAAPVDAGRLTQGD